MKRSYRLILILILLAMLGFNAIAYAQAYAMLNFIEGSEKTAAIEQLSFFNKASLVFTGVSIPKPINQQTPASLGLSCTVETIHIDDEVTLEAWLIPVDASGTAQPKGIVILFHGYADAKDSLLSEAAAFHQMGYATLLVDFRGSGGSTGHQTSVGIFEAEDVVKTVAYAQQHFASQPIILYGQSMGAVAILRALSVYHLQPDAVILGAVFDRMLSATENRFRSMHLPSFPAAQLLIFWGGLQNGYSGFAHNPVEYAESVNIPVLMLHGTADQRATLLQAEAVFAHLQTSHKWFERFEGVGHESYLRAKPEQWKTAVTIFLNRLDVKK